MDWDVAVATEDYHVFVLVVTVVANSTLSVVLSLDGSHIGAATVGFLLVLEDETALPALLYLLQDLPVLNVALPLLFLLDVLEEVFL